MSKLNYLLFSIILIFRLRSVSCLVNNKILHVNLSEQNVSFEVDENTHTEHFQFLEERVCNILECYSLELTWFRHFLTRLLQQKSG